MKSLRKIMQSKIFNNTPIKWDIITTTNVMPFSPELDYKGVKMSAELWEKKKNEAGLGARAKNNTTHEAIATNPLREPVRQQLHEGAHGREVHERDG